MTDKIIGGYRPTHPWYYLLGNRPLSPKQIRQAAICDGIDGYRSEEIAALANRAEPARSKALRAIREEISAELARDMSRYRQVVFELRARHSEIGYPTDQPCCADIHTAVSLKHNHLLNGFAHLAALDAISHHQADLFD